MIIMDLKMDNFYSFNDFSINFSYPKKIVRSTITDEFLARRPNFRYKKINVIMGSNATGKTTFGKAIMSICNFMYKKNLEAVTSKIADISKDAHFSMDFVIDEGEEYYLYRIDAAFLSRDDGEYDSKNSIVNVASTPIRKTNKYEDCSERLDKLMESKKAENYISELEKIEGLSWLFIFPVDSYDKTYRVSDTEGYFEVLEKILKTLDPAITGVEKLPVDNAFVVNLKNVSVIIQEGKITNPEKLSTGTKAGIEIAEMVASICAGEHDFYYCDEKFSYVSSDIEKAVFSLMIDKLKADTQLFFTTHNLDILDMPLPKHTFTFFKKTVYEDGQFIEPVCVSEFLKKSTDSVRNAVDNDLFNSAPSLDLLYDI